jgi:hypothetical protein
MGKHKRSTLMNYTKERLVDLCLCLEYNNEALNESFEIQYKNCMKMIDDMNLLNSTFLNRSVKDEQRRTRKVD